MNFAADYLRRPAESLLEQLPREAGLVAVRARKVLKGIDDTQLSELLKELDTTLDTWYLTKEFPEELGVSPGEAQELHDERQVLSWDWDGYISTPLQLYEWRKSLNKSDADLAHLFAALAIGLLVQSELCFQEAMEARREGSAHRHLEGSHLLRVGSYIVNATEAAMYAERLANISAEDIAKQARSALASKAAKQRHANTGAIKQEFVEFYRQGNFRSAADAARRFYQSLPAERQRLLRAENCGRTLVQALKIRT